MNCMIDMLVEDVIKKKKLPKTYWYSRAIIKLYTYVKLLKEIEIDEIDVFHPKLDELMLEIYDIAAELPELKDYELKLKQGKEQKPKYERSRLKLRKQTNK